MQCGVVLRTLFAHPLIWALLALLSMCGMDGAGAITDGVFLVPTPRRARGRSGLSKRADPASRRRPGGALRGRGDAAVGGGVGRVVGCGRFAQSTSSREAIGEHAIG